jgi:hypothetical protein
MNPHTDQLFQRYPLTGTTRLSTGAVPTPYHIYDGSGIFIGGKASLPAVRELLRDERVVPVQTVDGQALMGVWVCDFTDASLGAHHELQCSIFVTKGDVNPIASHPLGLLMAMLTRPDVQMLCHGLWNNTPSVVAYNREVLSLNARLAESEIRRAGRTLRFTVNDHTTGARIAAGELRTSKYSSVCAGLAMLSRLGLGRMWTISQQPWVRMHVVNPIGVTLERNAVAESLTKNDVNAVHYFDSQTDSLVFGDGPYRCLHFMPQFVQSMEGFKFVYLHPQ